MVRSIQATVERDAVAVDDAEREYATRPEIFLCLLLALYSCVASTRTVRFQRMTLKLFVLHVTFSPPYLHEYWIGRFERISRQYSREYQPSMLIFNHTVVVRDSSQLVNLMSMDTYQNVSSTPEGI